MKDYNKAGKAVVCMTAVIFSSVSYAKQEVDKPGFYASVSAIYTSEDNVFRQPTIEISDSALTLSPELLFIKTFGKHQFTAEYVGEFASYDKRSTENYADHFLSLDALYDLSRKFNVELQASYRKGHESRATSGIVFTDINEWAENRVFAGFAYGRKTAKALLEFDVALSDLEYTNNNQSFRDRETTAMSARVFFNLGSKTSIFAELKRNTYNYVNPAVQNLDSVEQFYHLGVRWEATNKTTGTFKVGSFDKDFDSAVETDGDDISYEATILWKPKTYSHFTLGLSSEPKETTTTDSFYIRSVISLNWDHSFNSRLSLNMNLKEGEDDFTGTRKDDISNAGIGVKYKFRRWMEVGLNYTTEKRDSTVNTADYTNNSLMLTAKWLKF